MKKKCKPKLKNTEGHVEEAIDEEPLISPLCKDEKVLVDSSSRRKQSFLPKYNSAVDNEFVERLNVSHEETDKAVKSDTCETFEKDTCVIYLNTSSAYQQNNSKVQDKDIDMLNRSGILEAHFEKRVEPNQIIQ